MGGFYEKINIYCVDVATGVLNKVSHLCELSIIDANKLLVVNFLLELGEK